MDANKDGIIMAKHIIKIKDSEHVLWLDMRKVKYVNLYSGKEGIMDDGDPYFGFHIQENGGDFYHFHYDGNDEELVKGYKNTIESYVDKYLKKRMV